MIFPSNSFTVFLGLKKKNFLWSKSHIFMFDSEGFNEPSAFNKIF